MLRPLSKVGKQIAQRRREFGWSQTELAGKSGVSRNTISRLETGLAGDAKWSNLRKLDFVLALNLEDVALLTQIGDMANDLGFGINDAGLLLFPIRIPGVKTRYEVLTPELLAKVAECL